MSKDGDSTRVQAYVPADVADVIDKEADRRDVSRSRHISEILEHHVENTVYEETARNMAAERRLQGLIAEGRDQLLETMDGTDEMVARAALYSVATFELIKQSYGPEERRRAFQRAADRLEEELGLLDIDPEALEPAAQRTTDPDATHQPASTPSTPDHQETSPQEQQDDDDVDRDWHFG